MYPEWLLILATIAGPVLAVQAQKWVELNREPRLRKLRLFQSLMATRAERLSAEHVRALNMIDIEFHGAKSSAETAVIDEWRIYHDHLYEDVSKFSASQLEAWTTRGGDFFLNLLFAMSKALGYTFDKALLKRGIYQPRAHGENEAAILQIRDSLVKILAGERSLPMAVTVPQPMLERQEALQNLITEFLSGNRPIKVTIENRQDSA